MGTRRDGPSRLQGEGMWSGLLLHHRQHIVVDAANGLETEMIREHLNHMRREERRQGGTPANVLESEREQSQQHGDPPCDELEVAVPRNADGAFAAAGTVNAILDAAESLVGFPYTGSPVRGLPFTAEEYRFTNTRNYRIFMRWGVKVGLESIAIPAPINPVNPVNPV